MTGVRKVTFSRSAVDDLEEIQNRFREQNVPEVGKRLVAEVLFQVERLAEYPESGRIIPEFSICNLREIIHPPFRIVYRLEQDRVRIVRVWRSERLLKLP